MKQEIKAGVAIPIVCAVGVAAALSAAFAFGAAATPADPVPANSTGTPCDVRPDAKETPCPPRP